MSKFVDAIKNNYSELPPWAKGIVFIGALGAIYLFASQTLSQIKSQAAEKEASKALDDAKKDQNNLEKKNILPSYTKTQYSSWADQILQAFKGTDFSQPMIIAGDVFQYSDSGEVVSRIFEKLKNDADYLSLKIAFGLKDYNTWLWTDVKNVTLEAAITDELNYAEIKGLNKILAKKKITYTL